MPTRMEGLEPAKAFARYTPTSQVLRARTHTSPDVESVWRCGVCAFECVLYSLKVRVCVFVSVVCECACVCVLLCIGVGVCWCVCVCVCV